jgi:alkylation response protein AidB-like acyl-CoA dehydrogenase
MDRRHLDFMLHEVLAIDSVLAYPRFAAHSRETCDAVIELAHKVALETFLPHARKSDLNEPVMVDGKVVLIPEIGEAVAAYNAAGFCAALADEADGGMQLPFVVAQAADAMFSAANAGTDRLPGAGARRGQPARRVRQRGPEAPLHAPIVEGRWFGTMCLSEPQAGSSLADIRTRAIAAARRQLPPRAARRCGSAPATTSSARTSSTWCWRRSTARRPA